MNIPVFMTLKVGLTGGIGSGKSVVSRIFKTLGIPVYNADESAKKMMEENPSLVESIISLFGKDAYINGKLNRPFIAKIAFGNPEILSKLNSLVHPATIEDANNWFRNLQSPYAIKEAALIFESEAYKELDFIIGVFAPLELRIERTMERDQTDRASVLKRMEQQMNQLELKNKCQFIIENDDKHLVIPQVLGIHQKILQSI